MGGVGAGEGRGESLLDSQSLLERGLGEGGFLGLEGTTGRRTEAGSGEQRTANEGLAADWAGEKEAGKDSKSISPIKSFLDGFRGFI